MMSWVRTIALKPLLRFMLSWNLGMSWLSIGYRECGWFHNKKYKIQRVDEVAWLLKDNKPWWMKWARNSPELSSTFELIQSSFVETSGRKLKALLRDGWIMSEWRQLYFLIAKNVFFFLKIGKCGGLRQAAQGWDAVPPVLLPAKVSAVAWSTLGWHGKFWSTEWRDQLNRNILYILIHIYIYIYIHIYIYIYIYTYTYIYIV